jgi:hypothetical protein
MSEDTARRDTSNVRQLGVWDDERRGGFDRFERAEIVAFCFATAAVIAGIGLLVFGLS